MKRISLYQLILVLVILVIAIKYAPPVNSWARSNLPESVLILIGEKPKNVFERREVASGKCVGYLPVSNTMLECMRAMYVCREEGPKYSI